MMRTVVLVLSPILAMSCISPSGHQREAQAPTRATAAPPSESLADRIGQLLDEGKRPLVRLASPGPIGASEDPVHWVLAIEVPGGTAAWLDEARRVEGDDGTFSVRYRTTVEVRTGNRLRGHEVWVDASSVAEIVATTQAQRVPVAARPEVDRNPARAVSSRPLRLSDEKPGIGEIGYTADGPLLAASSKAVDDRLSELLTAGDEEGVSQLVAAGLVYVVPKHTKCRVINVHGFLFQSYEIRILSGEHKGKLAFLPGGFLRKEE